jgi:hypothetical protein
MTSRTAAASSGTQTLDINPTDPLEDITTSVLTFNGPVPSRWKVEQITGLVSAAAHVTVSAAVLVSPQNVHPLRRLQHLLTKQAVETAEKRGDNAIVNFAIDSQMTAIGHDDNGAIIHIYASASGQYANLAEDGSEDATSARPLTFAWRGRR